MKKYYLFICLFILVVTGCSNNKIEKIIYKNSDQIDKIIYIDNDVNYHLMNIDNFKIIINNIEYDLEKAINEKNITFDEILENFTLVDVVYDGGTKIYKSFGTQNFTYNNDIPSNMNIFVCNYVRVSVFDGEKINKDIYITDGNTEYNNFCSIE